MDIIITITYCTECEVGTEREIFMSGVNKSIKLDDIWGVWVNHSTIFLKHISHTNYSQSYTWLSVTKSRVPDKDWHFETVVTAHSSQNYSDPWICSRGVAIQGVRQNNTEKEAGADLLYICNYRSSTPSTDSGVTF